MCWAGRSTLHSGTETDYRLLKKVEEPFLHIFIVLTTNFHLLLCNNGFLKNCLFYINILNIFYKHLSYADVSIWIFDMSLLALKFSNSFLTSSSRLIRYLSFFCRYRSNISTDRRSVFDLISYPACHHFLLTVLPIF